ncbi:hypothetical protein [Paenibacillus residui]|uniref:Uncharacterized protein n=1 Tax=Paenibacillus residui TaxID=629724 RepID=A0ABW3D5R2_9BACL
MSGGIEIEFPLIPTEEELREMRKEQTREKLQLLDGGKNSTENDKD